MGNKPMKVVAKEWVMELESIGKIVTQVAIEGRRLEITLANGQPLDLGDPYDLVDMRR